MLFGIQFPRNYKKKLLQNISNEYFKTRTSYYY